MPADALERSSPPAVAATPSTPDKPKSFSENRKSSKPIMEKRRRARINESLAQLKTLILDALKKDSSRHSKLEKADILEMTVKHLRGLQRIRMTGSMPADPSSLGKFRAGFSACAGEVAHFLSTCDGAGAEVRTRLLGHLAARSAQIGGLHPQRPGQTAARPAGTTSPPLGGGIIPCERASAMNWSSADASTLYGGFQVVPAVADGQFAFLVSGAALAPLGAPNCHRAHAEAMSLVGRYPTVADSVWRPW